ncbi:hypothetical protein Bbelb_334480 [Branchiostoma belcheri]|nr:hypothetical protein Bbelb_334480 [Branchiostoma belcheri]
MPSAYHPSLDCSQPGPQNVRHDENDLDCDELGTTQRTCNRVLSTCKNVGKFVGFASGEYCLRTESNGYWRHAQRNSVRSVVLSMPKTSLRTLLLMLYVISTQCIGRARYEYAKCSWWMRGLYADLHLDLHRCMSRKCNRALITSTTNDAPNRSRSGVACRPHTYTLRNLGHVAGTLPGCEKHVLPCQNPPRQSIDLRPTNDPWTRPGPL